MDQPTATLLKVAYAEGVKRALMEHGVDEVTASMQSQAFADEKLAGIREVGQMIGRAAQGAGAKARAAGKAVGEKARSMGSAVGSKAKDVAFDVKELPDSIRTYLKTNPNAKRNIALAAGGTALGAGALGAGGYALSRRGKNREE